MFGFVRPAACRSSAPRSVTDGCPHPPLPRRAKNRNKIQLFSHRKQEINENGGDAFHRCKNSFHRPRGGPPPSRREVWGLRRSRPAALPSIGYRGFAVAPITLRAPPIFCKLSIFPPQRPPSSREGDRPQTVEGVFSRRKAYSFPKLKYMRHNAEPCACLRRILLNFIFNSVRSVNSLPFSGGNIRPERKKFNKSNSPLSPPLTALKFLNIHVLFFRNSLDFAARHRLQ